MGGHLKALLCILGVVSGLSYTPHQKDYFVSDYILQDMMNKLSKDFSVVADDYLSLPEPPRRFQVHKLMANRVIKEQDNEDNNWITTNPVEVERLSSDPSPTIRDQEYLKHSSLLGRQSVAEEAGKGVQKPKPKESDKTQQQDKSDTNLPAYCDPPNPCPAGHDGKGNCLKNFENTAAFSRDYQKTQNCMCDSEHMFVCTFHDTKSIDIEKLLTKLSNMKDKKPGGKKYQFVVNDNPYFMGERLPVAAKKGNNLYGG